MRINIGLDPVANNFPLDSVDKRLDTTDALFVDIIHTQVTYSIPMGHVDFFPNGGAMQPGCSDPDTSNNDRILIPSNRNGVIFPLI